MSVLIRPILVQWASLRNKFIITLSYVKKLIYCQLILFLCLYPLSFLKSTNPATSVLNTATVPESPNSSQCTWSTVLRCHAYSGWRSSMDRPGEPGSGWPWDVGSTSERERQAVPWLRAHCIWGKKKKKNPLKYKTEVWFVFFLCFF